MRPLFQYYFRSLITILTLTITCFISKIAPSHYATQSYAREAEFDTLKEESEEILNKALKWLSKKILEAREDPSLHFGDFAEHFLTLGVSE